MSNPLLNKKGFTMVELIITIAISALVMSAVVTFMVSNMRNVNKSVDQIRLQADLQRTLNFVVTQIMESKGRYVALETAQEKCVEFTKSEGPLKFCHKMSENRLYWGLGEGIADKLLMENIIAFKVKESDDGKFANAEITARTGSYEITMNSTARYRNSN